MTIKEIHDYIVFILNKETTGYVSHKDIDAAIDRGQMSKFMELYSNPKQHQPGRPIPPIAYGQTQKISDDLRYFKKREQFTSDSDRSNKLHRSNRIFTPTRCICCWDLKQYT